jgi:hypothetical protein
MKKLWMLAALLLAALPLRAGADEQVKTGMMGGKPYFQATEKTTEQATVTRVIAAKRWVTLKGAEGDTVQIECGPEVKNFAQIKVGDLLKITYTEKLTIHVEGPGAAETTSETTTGSAKLGEKPSGSVTEKTEYKAKIASIDKAAGTATLHGYDGEEFVVTPLHPENLSKVAVGDLVVFTHTQAVAASVEKVAVKAPAKAPAKK